MPSHIQLYNHLLAALHEQELNLAFNLAEKLIAALKDSMMTYGWQRLPLSGKGDLDVLLLDLDRYLTGDRP